jgi:redox-sensitive bicupin YhaK (pirin superfamily)
MGFRALRVINEDRVAAGRGFGTHPHRNMEILSYVLEGALMHQDNMGTGSIIKPGDVQRMTAGTGVRHSEANASERDAVHFLQIWLLPDASGLKPSYEQRAFPPEARKGRLALVGSHDAREGSITIHQDVALYSAALDPGDRVSHAIESGRHVWVQVARGALTVNGQSLTAGDGAALSEESAVELAASAPSEALLFDLA